MPVKIKKLREDAVVPSYSKDGDAGMDITTTHIISNTTFDVTYGSGLALEVPRGYMCLIFPRSSIKNYELFLTNSVGVLDSGYRGEVLVLLRNEQNEPFVVSVGDRIAQLDPVPVLTGARLELVDDVNETVRGTGGFGSTGK